MIHNEFQFTRSLTKWSRREMECRKTENIQRQSEAAPGFWKKRAKKERREKESQVEKKRRVNLPSCCNRSVRRYLNERVKALHRQGESNFMCPFPSNINYSNYEFQYLLSWSFFFKILLIFQPVFITSVHILMHSLCLDQTSHSFEVVGK